MSKENQEVASKLIKITVLSLLFMAAEFIGGYLAHSIAIWSDAFHLLSDVLAYVISLVAVLLSEKVSPPYLTFGWVKAQTLGALFNVAFIYVVTIELFIQATHRMIRKDKVQQPVYMLITSIFGLICNFIILSILHNDPNGGHHGCSHDHHAGHLHQQEHQHQHEHHHHNGKPCGGSHIPLTQISKQNSQFGQNSKKKACSHGHSHHQHHHEHNHQEQPHHSHQNEHHHQKGCSHSDKKSELCQSQRDSEVRNVPSEGKKASMKQVLMDDGLLSSHQSDEQIKGHNHKTDKRNINLQAAYIHIITDIILSIGVIIAAVIIYFFAPQNAEWSLWHLADPLCTYLFSVLAVYSTWPILKESLIILLDGCDNPQLINEINLELKKLKEVKGVADLKVWSMNRGKYYASVRVRMQVGAGSGRVRQIFDSRGIDCFVEKQEQQIGLKE